MKLNSQLQTGRRNPALRSRPGACPSQALLKGGVPGWALLLVWALTMGSVTSSPAATPRVKLPYDRDCPVIYDNDYANDYVDWYLMALAGAGQIRYRGISTSSSIAPYNQHMPADALDDCVALRTSIVATGRASGLRNIPEPVAGTRGRLIKPTSGKVEDTQPLDSPGSRQIVREARAASAGKPLVVCVGGPLTVVADAYLLDNSIADKLVVTWLDNYPDGMYGFNGWSDGWAAFIVLEKLRLVQFTVESGAFASVPKDRLQNELPAGPMREFLLGIKPDVVAPNGDADGPPAISIMRPDYVQELKRVSFGGWKIADGHEVPMFRDDPNGGALVVTKADAGTATEEWWRALKNPALWESKP